MILAPIRELVSQIYDESHKFYDKDTVNGMSKKDGSLP